MKATVRWVDGALMLAETASGHTLVMDGPPDDGGRDLAPRPMELLLAGTGGCSLFDVVSILRKSRQPASACRVELTAERAAEPPRVFTRIHLHFVVTGRGLDPARVERAVRLSAEKYCSASIMLGATAEVTHDFEIVEAD